MKFTSILLTALSLAFTLTGLTWYAVAASCTSALPPDNAISGWRILQGTTKSGVMGEQASFDAYDGAVETLQEQGVTRFARRMYKRTGTSQHLTLDIYELKTAARAQALYSEKLNGYKKAKPLSTYSSIKDRAFVGTLGTITVGACQRGRFLCEVTISQAPASRDRSAARQFLVYVSKKLV